MKKYTIQIGEVFTEEKAKELKEYLELKDADHKENKIMTNTQEHAQKELDILIKTTPDAIIRYFIPEILALCEAFGNSGQSGGSAPYTAQALSQAVKKLCLQQPISPLTGEDNEWDDISNEELQNNRCSAVFKENGRAYYLDAIIWKTQKGMTWHGTTKEGITSRQYIKSFPFVPKTFIIDVIEKEVEKRNWEFEIKNMSDLDEVSAYYKKIKTN